MPRASRPRPRTILSLNNSRMINGKFDIFTLLTRPFRVFFNASQAMRWYSADDLSVRDAYKENIHQNEHVLDGSCLPVGDEVSRVACTDHRFVVQQLLPLVWQWPTNFLSTEVLHLHHRPSRVVDHSHRHGQRRRSRNPKMDWLSDACVSKNDPLEENRDWIDADRLMMDLTHELSLISTFHRIANWEVRMRTN